MFSRVLEQILVIIFGFCGDRVNSRYSSPQECHETTDLIFSPGCQVLRFYGSLCLAISDFMT